MKEIFKHIVIMIIVFGIYACKCIEPDSKYVINDFNKYYPDSKYTSIKSTEISPPCFYWEIKYIENKNVNDTLIETWQYWETEVKCEWRLRIIRQDTSFYVVDNDKL